MIKQAESEVYEEEEEKNLNPALFNAALGILEDPFLVIRSSPLELWKFLPHCYFQYAVQLSNARSGNFQGGDVNFLSRAVPDHRLLSPKKKPMENMFS